MPPLKIKSKKQWDELPKLWPKPFDPCQQVAHLIIKKTGLKAGFF
jgi:hypothetical protein